MSQISASFVQIIDIERYVAKIATEKISPRALNQLQYSLTEVESLKAHLKKMAHKPLKAIEATRLLCSITALIRQTTCIQKLRFWFLRDSVLLRGSLKDLDRFEVCEITSQSHLDAMLQT